MQEYKDSISSQFITLTYDTQHVPITRAGFMSLQKRDVQLFFKRLRFAHDSSVSIKYYAVGEYGGRTFRPHYHIIMFNADVAKIQEAWSLGQVHYGQVTGASVGYCLKYISKDKRIPMYTNDDREPEFGLQSKGLGAGYMTKAMIGWHKTVLEDRMHCTLDDGRKIAMPRYYKEKIYTRQERLRIGTVARVRGEIEIKQREYITVNGVLRPNWNFDSRAVTEGIKAAFNRMRYKSMEGKNKI